MSTTTVQRRHNMVLDVLARQLRHEGKFPLLRIAMRAASPSSAAECRCCNVCQHRPAGWDR